MSTITNDKQDMIISSMKYTMRKQKLTFRDKRGMETKIIDDVHFP
jgi:hypothetical protein